MKEVKFTVEELEGKARLDKVLRARFPGWGRKAVKALLHARKVRVNRKKVWLGSWEVKNGDTIVVTNPPEDKPQGPDVFDDSWIEAEEKDLIAVNKPSGLRAQSTQAGGKDNLLDLAQVRFGEVKLFHRLDRDTSGICLLTRPGLVNAYLDNAFKEGLVEKEYLAVVRAGNQLKEKGVITARLGQHPKRRDMMTVVEKGGQRAETGYEIIEEMEGKQLVRLILLTGRTHQLRVHLLYLGAPALGDVLYGGGKKSAPRLMLHARRIRLPKGEGFEAREFVAEVGEGFLSRILK